MSAPTFAIVVAVDADGGVGKGGVIPWHLPPDLRYFKALTTGPGRQTNAVIMGRKTWRSIPGRFRPLPGRLNVVLSRNPGGLAVPAGVLVAGSLDAALALTADRAQRFVIGGAQVYAEALARPECDRLAITRLDQGFGCDVVFPDVPQVFRLAHQTPRHRHAAITYRFQRWTRAASPG